MKTSTALFCLLAVFIILAVVGIYLVRAGREDERLLQREGFEVIAKVRFVDAVRYSTSPTSKSGIIPLEQARSEYARNLSAKVKSLQQWAARIQFRVDHAGSLHERGIYVPITDSHLFAIGSEHKIHFHPDVKPVRLLSGEQIR